MYPSQANGQPFSLFGNGGLSFEASLQAAMEASQTSHLLPTSKLEIDRLPALTTDESCEACTVCQEPFTSNDDARKLPCSHIFHWGCLSPWLKRQNTCPTCRHELLTTNFEYNSSKLQQPTDSGGCSLIHVYGEECYHQTQKHAAMMTAKCGCQFHRSCFTRWIRIERHNHIQISKQCPRCNQRIDVKEMIPMCVDKEEQELEKEAFTLYSPNSSLKVHVLIKADEQQQHSILEEALEIVPISTN